MTQDTIIKCTNCGEEINVHDAVYSQVNKQLNKKYQDDLQAELSKRESEMVAKVKCDIEEEQKDAIELLKAELEDKSSKVKDLNKTVVQLETIKREKEELESKYKSETAQQVASERDRIRQEEKNNNELHNRELQKQLEDQKKLVDEMKRKQEQGSMQMQGEVQELAIEEWLAEKFPLDVIEAIKKGERGGDCLQTVNTKYRQDCGSIYYESKRTKTFQESWIVKFKDDIQTRNASIGVLVTEAMPSGMERLGLKDGIWICSFHEFKGLCTVLRESLIQISTAIATQENKGDKMEMLYEYITSNKFRLQIEAIVEGFTKMKSDLDAEQRAMHKIWAKREKEIERVLKNTIGMHGAICGIANDVQIIPSLELGQGSDTDALEDRS